MARFHEVEVTQVRKTIRDAVVVTLEPRSGDFSFIQGQYVTFRKDFDGTELRRSYSICSGRDDGVVQVGIKHVEDGAFSSWANTVLQVGDVLEVMEPMGRFYTELSATEARNYVGFAGGSGITPILSIMKTTLSAEPLSTFTLVYANRSVNTVMFRDEIEDLKNQNMGRLSVIHVLENDAQGADLFTGRVDREKCGRLFEHLIDTETLDAAFICGPEPMMLEIAEALRSHGVSEDQIKYELFASGQPGRLAKPKASSRKQHATGELTVTLDGTSRAVPIAPDQSLLDAALENAIDAPYACTAGVCSTCKCKVLEGEVEMRANHALEDYEVARGYVLSCQAHPITKKVVIDYDQ